MLIRSFRYSEINTFRLSKFSKISFAFIIFFPIPVQEMVYLKAIQKSAPMGVSVSGTTDQKTYLKKFRGASAPLAPPWIRLCLRAPGRPRACSDNSINMIRVVLLLLMLFRSVCHQVSNQTNRSISSSGDYIFYYN